MKTLSLIVICFLVLQNASTQNVLFLENDSLYKVELFVKSICDSSVIRLNDFTLSLKEKKFNSENGYCYVPQKGEYLVDNFGINYLDVYKLYIYSNFHRDTLTRYRIYVSHGPGIPGWPYYSYCGKRCEGDVTDYWENGNIRICGKFKDGHIKNIRQYNKEGQLLLISKDHKLGSLQKVYENERLIVKLKRVLIFGFGKAWNPETKRYYRGEYYQLHN